MKSKKYILLAVLLVMVLSAPTTIVNAKNEKIYFTGTDTCDWDGVTIDRIMEVGQHNWLAKNWTMTCLEDSNIPQATGTTTMHLNINQVGNVFFWVGKGQLETDEGGVWNLNCVFPWPSLDAQCIGNGEGIYEGQQIFMSVVGDVSINGYIVEH